MYPAILVIKLVREKYNDLDKKENRYSKGLNYVLWISKNHYCPWWIKIILGLNRNASGSPYFKV